MNKLERRFLSQEFRVSDTESPKIEGYAALFDSASEDIGWSEVIDPHAFDGVMSKNPDCRALFNHDSNLILGRTMAGTLKLTIDSRGLAYEIDPPDTQVAKDLMVSMRRKDITGSSFGFITARDQWTENADGTVTRRILEIQELLDISPVTYPAYAATSAGVRSLPESMPAEFRSKFEKRDNINGCDCQCPECLADDCAGCSDADCSDENCLANQRSKPVSAEVRMKMEMQLQLAAIRK